MTMTALTMYDYVLRTAGLGRGRTRALSCFRLAETLKWSVNDGSGSSELHMVAECTCYTAVRERHQRLFEVVGGWQHVCDSLSQSMAD